jgi:hypothetical protein
MSDLSDEQRETLRQIEEKARELAALLDQVGDVGDLAEDKDAVLDLLETAHKLATDAPTSA